MVRSSFSIDKNNNRAGQHGLPRFASCVSILLPHQLHVVPLTANDVGTAFVVLFHVPVNPMPL
jgi:hypothetical protein